MSTKRSEAEIAREALEHFEEHGVSITVHMDCGEELSKKCREFVDELLGDVLDVADCAADDYIQRVLQEVITDE